MWQLSDHEVVNVYALSEIAKQALQDMIDSNPDASNNTTATHLPPLYPPLLSRLVSIPHRLVARILGRNPRPLDHPSGAILNPLRERIEYIRSIFRQPMETIRSGFMNTRAAPRWRPLIILIHLSTVGRPQLKTLFTGFVEAALLLVLTFFFAAQWGGNLYITAWALGLLLLFITVGRALALMYVWFSAQVWGLHIINCDEPEEILGCLRIVCSMEDVLVTVNGANYFNGYRLDYMESFRQWRVQYTSGVFDENVEQPGAKKTDTSDGSGASGGPEKNGSTTEVKPTLGSDGQSENAIPRPVEEIV